MDRATFDAQMQEKTKGWWFAGPRLDLLVAEVVHGWRIDYDSYRSWRDFPADEVDLSNLILTAPGDIFHGERSIAELEPYSTKIATAWTLVEHMIQGDHQRYLEFMRVMNYHGWSAPEYLICKRICHAVLVAYGVSVRVHQVNTLGLE